MPIEGPGRKQDANPGLEVLLTGIDLVTECPTIRVSAGRVIGDDLSEVAKQVWVASGAVVDDSSVNLVLADLDVVRFFSVVCNLDRTDRG
jgi:hypothetical protein